MTNPLPLPLTDGAFFVDNSFIEAFTACPRKCQYDRLMRRIPSAERPALNFGSAVHAALEYRYKTFQNHPVDALEEADIIGELEKHFVANPQPEDDHRSLNFAVDLVKHYNVRYAIEPFNLLVDKAGQTLVEISFCVPLFTYRANDFPIIPVYYTGRIDLPVRWDDQHILIDHKTTSMMGPTYFDGQKVSSQYEGYCWAFEQSTGLKADGFCINAIRSKEPPVKPRAGWDAWWDECFARHREYLRPGQLEEWKTNTINLVEEFFWHYRRDYLPQHKKSCTMYSRCAYYDVCYLPATMRDQELSSQRFTENVWTPLKTPGNNENTTK